MKKLFLKQLCGLRYSIITRYGITLYSASYGLRVEDGDTPLSEGINNTNVCTVSILYRSGLQFFVSSAGPLGACGVE